MSRSSFAAVAGVAIVIGLGANGAAAAPPVCPPAPVLQACFTPGQNCRALIVSVIDGARSEVLLQTYKFTDKPIIDALIRARARGVAVRLILDKSLEAKNTRTYQVFVGKGFDVRIDSTVKTAHNKVIVADKSAVVTGSFNFTSSAETRNAENILIVRNSPDIALAYAKNWQRRYDASRDPSSGG